MMHMLASTLTLDSPNTNSPSQIVSASRVDLNLPLPLMRFYRHGWHSWSQTGWLDPAVPPNTALQPMKRRIDEDGVYAQHPRHISNGLAAVTLADGQVVLLGGLTVGARIELTGQLLKGFYEGGSADEWFIASGNAIQIFKAYADLLHHRFGTPRLERAPRVWCSWYSLYPFVSEKLILRLLADLGDLPFDVIQIDDGWHSNIGDWEGNRKFPSGMASLAEAIRKTGRRAGLWLAPFMARDNSSIYREHPDWFLKDEQGRPALAHNQWGGLVYALDTTHPDALEWIAGLIKKVRSWGYDYLKLDFLYAGALPGIRHADMPREAAYRQGLQVIREAAGDAYVLACGAPILPSIGLCDGLRVGPDTGPYWENKIIKMFPTTSTNPSAQNALRISLERYWLKPLFHIDPDVVYFRSKRCSLTTEQKRMIQDLGQIMAFKAISDLPGWLTPSDRAALRTYLETDFLIEQVEWYRFRLDGREVVFDQEIIKPANQLSSSWNPARVEQVAYFYEVIKGGLPAAWESLKK